jgi:hypothetical protein
MAHRGKRSWFDVLVDFSPILALLLVWLSVAQKATKVGNPHTWVVGLTTLPALAAILYSGWVVYKGKREPQE